MFVWTVCFRSLALLPRTGCEGAPRNVHRDARGQPRLKIFTPRANSATEPPHATEPLGKHGPPRGVGWAKCDKLMKAERGTPRPPRKITFIYSALSDLAAP